MKQLLALVLLMGMLAFSVGAQAQQSKDFAHHEVHYNALNTDLISPQMAQAYGIQRSSSRALLTVTVLKKEPGGYGTPVHAGISASCINLTGQRRTIDMREVTDAQGGVYFIGELPVYNMETYNFTVQLTVAGEDEPLIVKFRQQFYTE